MCHWKHDLVKLLNLWTSSGTFPATRPQRASGRVDDVSNSQRMKNCKKTNISGWKREARHVEDPRQRFQLGKTLAWMFWKCSCCCERVGPAHLLLRSSRGMSRKLAPAFSHSSLQSMSENSFYDTLSQIFPVGILVDHLFANCIWVVYVTD